MRVLARREPVDARSARLVVTPGRPASEVKVVTKPSAAGPITPAAGVAAGAAAAAPASAAPVLSPAQLRARRASAKRATKRRRVVLAVLLLATIAMVTVAALGVVPWWSVAVPVGLLLAWLVACRLMVKGERAALAPRSVRPSPARVPAAAAEDAPAAAEAAEPAPAEAEGDDPMADTSAGLAAVVDPTLWDPVPVTLPTYVSKPPAARRSVRTIDLDSTGVWTSGRTDADAQLAREAEQADRAARQQREKTANQRAVGS
jgi:Ca2+/Na+ antiporter